MYSGQDPCGQFQYSPIMSLYNQEKTLFLIQDCVAHLEQQSKGCMFKTAAHSGGNKAFDRSSDNNPDDRLQQARKDEQARFE